MQHTSVMSSLTRAFQMASTNPTLFRPALPTLRLSSNGPFSSQQTSGFSTTVTLAKKKKGRAPGQKVDRRVTMLRYALFKPLEHLPRTLRFGRPRALRHWTIHRAWQLWQGQQRAAHERELERQWESMRAACEELRVGAGDQGRLFRQSMAKKGYWGGRSDKGGSDDGGIGDGGGVRPGFETGDSGRVEKGREGGVPIEYARGLVDTPAREGGWDHAWTRA